MGYDPYTDLKAQASGSSVYAENVQKDTQSGMRGLLAREALRYGLACSETAFIAVRTEAGKQVEGTAIVANALPSGWSEDFETAARGIVHAGARNYINFAMAAPMSPPPGPPPPSPAQAPPSSLMRASAAYDASEELGELDTPAFLRKASAAPKPAASSSGGGGLLGKITSLLQPGAKLSGIRAADATARGIGAKLKTRALYRNTDLYRA